MLGAGMRHGVRVGVVLVVAVALAGPFVSSSVPSAAAALGSHGVSPRAAVAVPAAPFVTDVAPRGLGLLVSWVPADASVAVSSYALTALPVPAAGVTIGSECTPVSSTVVPGSDSSAIVGGLCAQVPYSVTVTTTNAGGTSPPSAGSDPVVVSAGSVPAAPQITNVLGRNRELIVSWAPPSDNGGSPVTGFTLTAKHGSKSVSVSVGGSVSSATLTGVRNNQPYALSLVATNTIGPSAEGEDSGTPHGPVVPSVPVGLSVVPVGSGRVSVSWGAPADDGGKPVTRFRVSTQQVVQQIDPGTGAVSWIPAPNVPPVLKIVSGSPTSLRGLNKKLFYEFAVAAKNAKGYGPATPATGPTLPQTTIGANTVQLNDATLAALASDVNGTLTWPAPAPRRVTGLQPGQIIAGGISTVTPDGLLATVLTVTQPVAGTYVVTTGPASLADAFPVLNFTLGADPAAAVAGVGKGTASGLRVRVCGSSRRLRPRR